MGDQVVFPEWVVELVAGSTQLGPRRSLVGREEEIDRVITCFAGTREGFGDGYAQPILIGPKGSGKTAIIKEAIRRWLENPDRFRRGPRRFFQLNSQGLTTASFDDFEAALDALNDLPEYPVLYLTDMHKLASRYYPNHPEQAFHFLTQRLQRRRRLFLVTEMERDEYERGLDAWTTRRYERIELSDQPLGDAEAIVLAHSDPHDPSSAGPYVSHELAGLIAGMSRGYLARGISPGVLVDFLAAVRARAGCRREVARDDIDRETINRTGLPAWRFICGERGAALHEGLQTAESSVITAVGDAPHVREFVSVISKFVEDEVFYFGTDGPKVLLFIGQPTNGLAESVATNFFGQGSLIEVHLGSIPRTGFVYPDVQFERGTDAGLRRVFLLHGIEDAPERYMMGLEGHLTHVQDTARSNRGSYSYLYGSLIVLTTRPDNVERSKSALGRVRFTTIE